MVTKEELIESFKKDKEKHKKFLNSLSPEQREQWLKYDREMKREEKKKERFISKLSSEQKELRNVLLSIGDKFYRFRQWDKGISRISCSGKIPLWDLIRGDVDPKNDEERRVLKMYGGRRKEIFKEAEGLFKKIKNKYSREDFKKVLLKDELFSVFTMLNMIDDEFQEESEREEDEE